MRCFKIKTFTNSWVFVFSYKSFSLCSWENKLSWKMSVCLFLLYNSTDLYFLEHISSKGCQWWLQDGKFSLQLPPSSKMQAATWLHGSACLKKTKGTSFFHVIIKKIKGKKKLQRHQWFHNGYIFQVFLSPREWQCSAMNRWPTQTKAATAAWHEFRLCLKVRPSVNITFHTSLIKHQLIFMEYFLSRYQRFNFLHVLTLTTGYFMFLLSCELIGRPKWN